MISLSYVYLIEEHHPVDARLVQLLLAELVPRHDGELIAIPARVRAYVSVLGFQGFRVSFVRLCGDAISS
eukprot:2096091-Pyramimonas_sp.AAC.1